MCVRQGETGSVCVLDTAVLGGQVFSCFCFLGADTGVNIQKMMSQPEQRGQTPVQSQAQFPQRPVKHQNNLLSHGACAWECVLRVRLAPGHAVNKPSQQSPSGLEEPNHYIHPGIHLICFGVSPEKETVRHIKINYTGVYSSILSLLTC